VPNAPSVEQAPLGRRSGAGVRRPAAWSRHTTLLRSRPPAAPEVKAATTLRLCRRLRRSIPGCRIWTARRNCSRRRLRRSDSSGRRRSAPTGSARKVGAAWSGCDGDRGAARPVPRFPAVTGEVRRQGRPARAWQWHVAGLGPGMQAAAIVRRKQTMEWKMFPGSSVGRAAQHTPTMPSVFTSGFRTKGMAILEAASYHRIACRGDDSRSLGHQRPGRVVVQDGSGLIGLQRKPGLHIRSCLVQGVTPSTEER